MAEQAPPAVPDASDATKARKTAAAKDTPGPTKPPGARDRIRAFYTRHSSLLKHFGLFLLACLAAFMLEHVALERMGGSGSQTSQGLLGFRAFYVSAVSSWPRELIPRHTAIVHIESNRDPTARGLAHNVCLQREYLASLLPALAERHPAIIVIDKYFTSAGCIQAGPTDVLLEAVAKVSARVPVVVGLNIDRSASPPRGAPPLLEPPLAFKPSPSLREGIVNRDEVTLRRIPLGWTVRYDANDTGQWRDGIALATAIVREPRLLAMEPRLKKLRDERDNPYTSMIGQALFTTLRSGDVLCADETMRQRFAAACAQTAPGTVDPSYLTGRIVILGETGPSIDRHDSTVDGEVPGSILQANYVESLLDGRYFLPAPAWLNYVVGFLFFVAMEASLRSRRRLGSLAGVVLLIVVTFGLLSLAVRYLGYFIDPAVSVVVLVLMLTAWVFEAIAKTGEPQHAS
jgi:CHASE2 domain-containing sensor protein